MPLIRTTEPSTWPLSVIELKSHLRADDLSDEDAWLNAAIESVTVATEESYNIQFIKASFRFEMSSFIAKFDLPRPVVDIDSVVVKYYDENDELQTLASTNYELITHKLTTSIRFFTSAQLPRISGKFMYPVRIEFDAGHASADELSPSAKLYLLVMCGYEYVNREGMVESKFADMAETQRYRLGPYIRRYVQ